MDSSKVRELYNRTYTDYARPRARAEFDGYERNVVLRRIFRDGRGKRILDVGAGSGVVAEFLLSLGYKVSALEWTDLGAKSLRDLGVDVSQHDIEETPYPYPDGSFDEIFWGDNVEHLFFPLEVGRELVRCLKDGGRLVVSTPNHGWVVNRIYYAINGVPRRTEGHVAPIWEWQHIRTFNAATLVEFLHECGLGRVKVHGGARRWPFKTLSRWMPRLMASVIVLSAEKG